MFASLKLKARELARDALPARVVDAAKRLRNPRGHVPSVGMVRFGDLRRLTPVSRQYGFDRGRPIDRYYIEHFLESRARDIHGRVLEIGENTYTKRFGRGVTKSDVLHVSEGVAGATFVDDLTEGRTLPTGAFDCVILTQTLHLIFDMRAALQTLDRVLKPGGTLLATVPGITQVADAEWNDTWYWSLTAPAARKLFSSVFAPSRVEVKASGNVLSAISFLQGLSDSELTRDELEAFDPEYPVTIAIRATSA